MLIKVACEGFFTISAVHNVFVVCRSLNSMFLFQDILGSDLKILPYDPFVECLPLFSHATKGIFGNHPILRLQYQQQQLTST